QDDYFPEENGSVNEDFLPKPIESWSLSENNSKSSTRNNVKINSRCFYNIDKSDKRTTLQDKRRAIMITAETSVFEQNFCTADNNSELCQVSKDAIPDQMLVRIKSLEFDSKNQIKPDVKKSIRLVTQSASHQTEPDTSLEGQIQKMFLFPFNYHSLVFDTLKLDIYSYGSLLNKPKRLGRAVIRLNVLKQAISNREGFERTFPLESKELHPYEVGTVQINIGFHFRNDPPISSIFLRSVITQIKTLSIVHHGIEFNGHGHLNTLVHPESKPLSIFDFILSKKTTDSIKEFVSLFYGFHGHGWQMTKLEIMKAYILLEKYYDQKPKFITGNLITNIDKLKKAKYYLKFSIATYGSFMFNVFGYGYKMAPKNAMRMKSDRKIIQDYFGISKDDIICWEFGKMTVSVPNYMIIRDPKTNSIIISIRGTLNATDIITDVLAHYEPWNGGFVHRGMLRSAQYLVRKSLNDIRAAVSKFKANSIQVIGHSLGASVSCLVTLILRKQCKDLLKKGIDIHAWAFATPPSCSLDIACRNEVMDCIDNFVNENDIIPRLSYGSFIDFKELIKFVAKNVKNRSYKKNKKMYFNYNLSLIMESIDNYYKNLKSKSHDQKLYIPGTIYYMYKKRDPSNPILKEILCEKSTQESFTDITLRRNCLLQHLPDQYDKRLGKVINRLVKNLDCSSINEK
ncbi:7261_t:CDS:10, partial [Scutellospora calospora]